MENIKPGINEVELIFFSRTDEGQASLVKAFESSKGRDKGRNVLARELSLKSVGDL